MGTTRYWKVQVLHRIDEHAEAIDVIGVVADSKEMARAVCEKYLVEAKIIEVTDGGPVRFISHSWVGKNTKVYVNGEQADAAYPQ